MSISDIIQGIILRIVGEKLKNCWKELLVVSKA